MASKRRPATVVTGVSVANRRIAVVRVSCDDQGVILDYYKSVAVAAGMIENGIVTEVDVFSQSLRKNFTEWNLGSTSINLCVPSGAVVSKVSETPKMKKRETYHFFKADVDEHPLLMKSREKNITAEQMDEMDEEGTATALTYTMTSYNEDNERYRYFVMAAPLDLFNSYQKTFKIVDKDIESFTSECFGVIAFLQLLNPLPDESNFVLFVSDDSSEFMVVKGLSVLFYHKAHFNVKDILKRPLMMSDVITRIQLLLFAYQDKYPEDNSIEKIILVSNAYEILESFDENMDELKEKIDKPIVVLNPLQYVNASHLDLDQNILKKDIYQLIPAIGICIASSRGYDILDFLKNKSYSGPIFSRKDMYFTGIVAFVAAVLIAVLYLFSGYYVNRLNEKLVTIREKLVKSDQANRIVESGQTSKIKVELAKYQKLLDVKTSRLEFLDTLTELMPTDLWLEKVDIKINKDDAVISFSGKGSSRSALELFIRNLKEEYDKIELDMVKITQVGVEYSIKCTKGRDDK